MTLQKQHMKMMFSSARTAVCVRNINRATSSHIKHRWQTHHFKAIRAHVLSVERSFCSGLILRQKLKVCELLGKSLGDVVSVNPRHNPAPDCGQNGSCFGIEQVVLKIPGKR